MIFRHPELLFSSISILTALFLFILLSFKLRSRGGISFAFLSLIVVIWQSGKLIKNLSLVLPLQIDIPFWSSLSFAGVTFIFSFFLRLASLISFRNRGIVKFLTYLGFFFSALFVVLELTGMLTYGERITQYGYFRLPGPLYHVYTAVYFFFMGVGLFILYPQYYNKIPQLKRQITAIFIGSSLGFGLGCLEFLGVYGLAVYPIADLSPVLFGGTLYWAIYRFNIFSRAELVKGLLFKLLRFAILFSITGAIYFTTMEVVRLFKLPANSLLLVLTFSIILFSLTPLYIVIVNGIRRHFFPVRFSYRKLNIELSQNLSGLDSRKKMFQTVLDKMESEFGYQNGKAVLFDYHNSRFYRNSFTVFGSLLPDKINGTYFQNKHIEAIISRPQILEALRLGYLDEKARFKVMMSLRLLNRLQADLILPVHAHSELIGLLLFSQKSFRPEGWETAANLLNTLVTILGSHVYQVCLLKTRSEQEHLSKVGIMAASLAHEIKNPLEGIYGSAQILKESAQNNRKFVDIILNDTVRLNEVVQRFLQFSKIFKPEIKTFDLIPFLEDFVNKNNTVEQANSLELLTELTSLEVKTDKDGLNQILLNLVQNSMRYQVPGKPVKVTAKTRDNHMVIHVEDEGPGISEEVGLRVFEPFFTTSAKGTGLGLAISQKIAKSLSGSLRFEQRNPGTRFILALPLKSL